MNVAGGAHLVHAGRSGEKVIAAPHDAGPAAERIARRLHQQSDQVAAGNRGIGKQGRLEDLLEEIQLEVAEAHIGIAGEQAVEPLAGLGNRGVEHEAEPLHAGEGQARQARPAHGKHIDIPLGDPGMRLDSARRDPEAGLHAQLRDTPGEPLHAVGKQGVGLPFAVAVLPAVVDNDPLDVLAQHRVGRDELGVPDDSLLRHGPPVIVPGIPARRGGNRRQHLRPLLAGPGLQQNMPAVFRKQGQRLRLHGGRRRAEVERRDNRQVAHGFPPGRAREPGGIFLGERLGQVQRFAVARQRQVEIALKGNRFLRGQRHGLASASRAAVHQHVIGRNAGDRQRGQLRDADPLPDPARHIQPQAFQPAMACGSGDRQRPAARRGQPVQTDTIFRLPGPRPAHRLLLARFRHDP